MRLLVLGFAAAAIGLGAAAGDCKTAMANARARWRHDQPPSAPQG